MNNVTVPEVDKAQAYLDENYQQQHDQLYLVKKKTNKIFQVYAYLELLVETV